MIVDLPQGDGKLRLFRQKRRSHKYLNLGKARDRTKDPVARKQRSYLL